MLLLIVAFIILIFGTAINNKGATIDNACAGGTGKYWNGEDFKTDRLYEVNEGNREILGKIWDSFRSTGLTEAQTAGIMGNINGESNFKSTIEDPTGPYYGLIQLSTSRWGDLKTFAASRQPAREWTDVPTQAMFVQKETKERDGVKDYLKQDGWDTVTDPVLAARIFFYGSELNQASDSSHWYSDWGVPQNREQPAAAIYAMFKGSELGTNCGGGSSTTGHTTAVLPASLMATIQSSKSTYVAAANKYHVPWQALAAIHYRESGSDPNRSGPSGEKPGTKNPDSGKVECVNFQDCEEARARHLISLAKTFYKVTVNEQITDADIQKAFLAYNRGGMYINGGCTVEQSPYVWNNYDSAHKLMRWPNSSCEPASTRGRVDTPNGAYTIYVYLLENKI